MHKLLIFFILLSSIVLAKPTVSVSILPQKYFVKQISKELLDINVMLTKGQSPATYEPKPKQMKELENSDIYFSIGVPYERVWLNKFQENYPKLNIVKTQENIKKIAMKSHHHENEVHHEEEIILDPHIWLDPLLVKIQAKNITTALQKQYPQYKDIFNKNLEIFLKKLDLLHEEISQKLKEKKGKKFLVYHPTWGYFALRYGLIQEVIEIEGKEPKSQELLHIIDDAKKDNISVIFTQPQFSNKSAKIIANSIGAKLIQTDTLSLDWENELKNSVKKLSNSLK